MFDKKSTCKGTVISELKLSEQLEGELQKVRFEVSNHNECISNLEAKNAYLN